MVGILNGVLLKEGYNSLRTGKAINEKKNVSSSYTDPQIHRIPWKMQDFIKEWKVISKFIWQFIRPRIVRSKNNRRSYPVIWLHISIVSKGEIKEYTNNPGDTMYSIVTIVNNTVLYIWKLLGD